MSYVKVDPSLLEDAPPPLDAYVQGLVIDAELERQAEARRRVFVDPLVAELKPTARFLEELNRIVREATTPRYVRNAYVPVDLVVQISGDPRLFYNPRDRHGYPSRLERALHPTPGYTRNMLGAREAARDWRLHR